MSTSQINDPKMSGEYMAYLLRFDSVHGEYKGSIRCVDTKDTTVLYIDENPISVYGFKNPADIPWKQSGAELIAET